MNGRSYRIRIPLAIAAVAAFSIATLTACVPGQPSAQDVAAAFNDTVKPAWNVEVPGIYGEAAVVDDVVIVYAQEADKSVRIEAHDTKTGKLLWKHRASPGGAWDAPLFSETQATARAYPIPTLKPFIVSVGSGDQAKPKILYAERTLTDTEEFYNPDILHLADPRTGKDLKLTAPDFDKEKSDLLYDAAVDDKGHVTVQPFGPFRMCTKGQVVCFENGNGGFYRLNLKTREVTNTKSEFDPNDGNYERDWGNEYVQVIGDAKDAAEDTLVARMVNGKEKWRIGSDDLFGEEGGSPAELRDFTMAGGLLLVQGYRSISENTDDATYKYDFTQSRNLAAVDPDTGKVVWRAKGVDSLCFAVSHWTRSPDSKVIPVCHATAGSFLWNYGQGKMLDWKTPAVSIAGLNVKDGSLTWEVKHAGDQAVLEHGRMLDAVFSSGTNFSVVDTAGGAGTPDAPAPKIGVLDLTTGKLTPVPKKSAFVCETERPGVELKFKGSMFVNPANPLSSEYPAGWYQFACDRDAKPAKTWTKGSVQVAGLPAADGRVIVVTEKGLAGFAL